MALKAFLLGAGVIVVLVCVAAGALLSGLGNERLRLEALAAVDALAGDEFETTIGRTRLSLDGLSMLTLEVSDVRLTPREGTDDGIHIGAARFALRFLPLLQGDVRLGRMRVENARIALAALAQADEAELSLFDENGIVDQDAAVAAVFAGAQHMAATLYKRDVDRIRLDNVAIMLPGFPNADTLRVTEARLLRLGSESYALDGQLEIMGRASTVKGQLERDAQSGLIAALDVEVVVLPVSGDRRVPLPQGHSVGSASLHITGMQTGLQERLQVVGRATGIDIDFNQQRGERIVADVAMTATALSGTGKLEIDDLRIGSGRSNWSFHGAFGADPETEKGYRFELVSDGSSIAQQGSSEPSLQAVARIFGHMDAKARTFDISEIGVRSREGEVRGSTKIVLEPGHSPGLQLRLDVADMPVGQVKQLWPWFAARGAHDWVQANVFGGRVNSGWIQIDAPPGRMDDGVAFGPDELSGQFLINGTRFDVTGRIPPVRDGNGVVEIAGTSVDISLQSGTVFMAGNRTVDATNGTLRIPDTSHRPLIAKLEIDVDGEAEAVLQLARYDPIDVSRFVDIAPEELSGDVKGRIFADIPFQRETRIEDLNWKVDLSYENLNLTRPFEGQQVASAKGTIVVDPEKAIIDASAHLNAAPASIRIVEPLGASGVERERRVALQMNDAARNVLAPGLDTLLTGTVGVELDDLGGGTRNIRASLDRALLSIPWVGWSKGTGVPANVTFSMKSDGTHTTLSDFRLSGDTFGARGSLSLVNGDVASINLSSAKLNRGDDFSLSLKTQGGGYVVSVTGKSIDARSVIKFVGREVEGAAVQAQSRSITLDVAVDSMSGFHGEVLRNVNFHYSGVGARTDAFEFSATTTSGHRVHFSDRRDSDVRSVAITSSDAGALLRFLDIYQHVEGGTIALNLRGIGDAPLSGQIDARDFWVVNEPRLRSLVASPAGGGRSLNQAVRSDMDTTRVQFERAFSLIDKGKGYLNLERGVLRGPMIGSTFQGTLYDAAGNMDMTGTFMPAYGLNRIFGEIPLIGQILGNGRDRGLIGITFRLAGKSSEPQLQVNPLSVIAPGIFRSVFEYR